jgi:hypothetical protein
MLTAENEAGQKNSKKQTLPGVENEKRKINR